MAKAHTQADYDREWAAFQELKRLGRYESDDQFVPYVIQYAYYSKSLGSFPESQSKPQQQQQQQQQTELTAQDKIDTLRAYAGELIEANTSHGDRIPLMRAMAHELEISLRDSELQRLVWDARRATTGAAELLTQADEIDLTPTPWCWDGVVIAGALNLLVSLPKIGKTSLLLAWIAAWHRGDLHFLDRELVGTCPPVLIVGTDQPKADWARMMRPLGLVNTNDAGTRGRLQPPIIGLAHAGQPIHLDPEGIERIAAYASEHPGLLVVVDSLATCMRPLGIAEESADFAGPIGDLMEAIEPHGATVVAIHHSNKGRAGDSATMASRGSTALPAAASQIIKMGRVPSSQPNPADRRVVVETEGRGGLPVRLLIERDESGAWISHGDAEAVTQAQQRVEQEESLSDAHRDALEAVRELCEAADSVTAAQVADRLQLRGDNAERTMRRRLDAIARRGLMVSDTIATLHGRQKRYRPAGEDRTPSTPTLVHASDVSDVSDPPLIREDPSCVSSVFTVPSPEGSDTSDGKDTCTGVGGDRTLRRPEDGANPIGKDTPPAELLAKLQALRLNNPKWHPHQLAVALDPTGNLGINGRKVKGWLPLLGDQPSAA